MANQEISEGCRLLLLLLPHMCAAGGERTPLLMMIHVCSFPCPRWHPKHLEDMSGAKLFSIDNGSGSGVRVIRWITLDLTLKALPSPLSGIKRFYGDEYKYGGCCKFGEHPKAGESRKGSQTTRFVCTSLKGSDCFACVFSTQQYGGERRGCQQGGPFVLVRRRWWATN